MADPKRPQVFESELVAASGRQASPADGDWLDTSPSEDDAEDDDLGDDDDEGDEDDEDEDDEEDDDDGDEDAP